METIIEGRIISVPITHGDVKLTNFEGYALKDDDKKPLVYHPDKGVFMINGYTSKLGGILSITDLIVGIEYNYAPLKELRKLVFEYKNPKHPANFVQNDSEYLQLPIIDKEDYITLNRLKDVIDIPTQDKIRCVIKYNLIDNTDEARKEYTDTDSSKYLVGSTKAAYYAKLVYTPMQQWDNIIDEARRLVSKVRPVTDAIEREKVFLDYLKNNYYPPTKIKQ